VGLTIRGLGKRSQIGRQRERSQVVNVSDQCFKFCNERFLFAPLRQFTQRLIVLVSAVSHRHDGGTT